MSEKPQKTTEPQHPVAIVSEFGSSQQVNPVVVLSPQENGYETGRVEAVPSFCHQPVGGGGLPITYQEKAEVQMQQLCESSFVEDPFRRQSKTACSIVRGRTALVSDSQACMKLILRCINDKDPA